MALRGVAAIACTTRGRNVFLSSTNHYFHMRFHLSPSHALQRFTSYPPNHQTGFRNQIRAIQEATVDPLTSKKEYEKEDSPENWKVKMLYDGDCPLCMREVNMLKERNKQYGTIKFVDISSDEYSSEENQGLDYKTVMGRIHAILSDGTVVRKLKVEFRSYCFPQVLKDHRNILQAFRRLYEEVGLGWVYAITKYEPIATVADVVYGVWAKYRLPITGRPPLEEILEARRKNKGEVCGDNRSCDL